MAIKITRAASMKGRRVKKQFPRHQLSQRRNTVARSRNQLAKAAFSAGADAAGLRVHRTPERPGRQTNLLPALPCAKPQTGQGPLARVPGRMKMNASYLSTLFSQTTGVTFHQFLEEVRLSKTKELLRDPRNRGGEVASAAGYAGPDSFRHAFKAHEGLSPAAWRAGQ